MLLTLCIYHGKNQITVINCADHVFQNITRALKRSFKIAIFFMLYQFKIYCVQMITIFFYWNKILLQTSFFVFGLAFHFAKIVKQNLRYEISCPLESWIKFGQWSSVTQGGICCFGKFSLIYLWRQETENNIFLRCGEEPQTAEPPSIHGDQLHLVRCQFFFLWVISRSVRLYSLSLDRLCVLLYISVSLCY